MERDTNRGWALSLFDHLDEDWPLAMNILCGLMAARFATRFRTPDEVRAAVEAMCSLVTDEALARLGAGGNA